jgi:hypothetical protein
LVELGRGRWNDAGKTMGTNIEAPKTWRAPTPFHCNRVSEGGGGKGHVFPVAAAKGFGQAALFFTVLTFDGQVAGLAGRALFKQAQEGRVTRQVIAVDKLNPGKIVQVPLFASDQEASGHRRRAFSLVAIFVDIPGPVGPVAIVFQDEQPRVQ